MRFKVILVGLVVAGLAMPSTAWAATARIHNGGFESPIAAPGSFLVFGTGQTFAHWTVMGAPGNVGIVSGTFTQNGFSFPAKSGHQWLDLTGLSQSATGVEQTVATTPGLAYTLHFSIGNVNNPGGIFGTTSTVKVLLNGTQIGTATNSAGGTTQVWKSFKVHFTATSASSTIALVNGDPPNDTNDGLDAVKLSQP
jgi:Protein of unknown function (DUF642)